MSRTRARRGAGALRPVSIALAAVAASLLVVTADPGLGASGVAADSVVLPRLRPDDPWRSERLLTPQALARTLRARTKPAPFLIHVGFGVLYRAGHIPNSVLAGPGSKREGVSALRDALKDVAKDRPVVIYCGCCPWGDCPNLRPAFRAAAQLGFKDVRVLYLPRSLKQDWIDKGYPVEPAAH